MSVKFGRSYRVTIDLGDGSDPIIIGMPLTVQFTVQRRQLSSLNVMHLDIYNLSKKIRDLIFQEFFTTRRKKITFEGGYDTLSLLFEGDIFQASSRREGTNIITSIESRAGSWDVSQSNIFTTFEKGQTVGDIMRFLIGGFPDLKLGAVGKYDDVLLRPTVLNGRRWDLLKKYSDGDVFIDNNKVFVLKRNEVIEGDLPIINDQTGILDSPRRDGGFLEVATLFEPRLIIGQEVVLESTINPIYNGTYKIIGLQHTGTISQAVGGDARTIVHLFIGSQTFETVIDNDGQ